MSCFSSCVSRPESPECSRPRIQPLLDTRRLQKHDRSLLFPCSRGRWENRKYNKTLSWKRQNIHYLSRNIRGHQCSGMWGLCLVISAAGAAAGRASVPPWICCSSRQTDQISLKPQSHLNLQPKTLVHDQLCVWPRPKQRNRLQTAEQALWSAFKRNSAVSCALTWGGRWCAMLAAAATGVRGNNDWIQRPARPFIKESSLLFIFIMEFIFFFKALYMAVNNSVNNLC